MARLSIPEPFRPALAKIATLSDEAASEFLEALQNTPPTVRLPKMASKMSARVKAISESDLKEILGAVVALYSVRSVNAVPLVQFVDDLCQAMQSANILTSPNCEILKPRLLKLLDLESMSMVSKAGALERERQHILIAARVLSDIRAVFPDGPEYPSGAIVVHDLKLSYLEAGKAREFFVALDDDDLAVLLKVIARAQTKSKALRTVIEKAGLTDLAQE